MSGSSYFEGTINATEGGYIAGWEISGSEINSPGRSIRLDSTNKSITVYDGSANPRVTIGQINTTSNYFGISGSDAAGNLLFKLGEAGNEIAGWEISGSRIHKYNGSNGGLIMDASGLRYDVYTGSVSTQTIVRMGELDGSNSFGILGNDTAGNLLFKLGMLGNEIAG